MMNRGSKRAPGMELNSKLCRGEMMMVHLAQLVFLRGSQNFGDFSSFLYNFPTFIFTNTHTNLIQFPFSSHVLSISYFLHLLQNSHITKCSKWITTQIEMSKNKI